MTENQEQAALFEWAGWMEHQIPELKLLHSCPNGGYRLPKTAAVLQKTGVKSGVPDVCLPVSNGKYHALYIEMKRVKGGAVSANQRVWLNELSKAGNRAVVCKGFEQARDTILEYLGVKSQAVQVVNSCVSCGAEMPEGDQVCITCRKEWNI